MSKQGFVYILASKRNGTLYVGVTSDLLPRIYQHKHGLVDGFTKRHHVHRLVHFQTFDDMASAIQHEKRLKRWKRDWKIALIEKINPRWLDLTNTL